MTTSIPIRATGSHFYKYSNAEHLEWLKTIILEHKLYLPNLDQLNDPADGRPRLASLSEDQTFSFLHADVLRRHPHWTCEAHRKEAMILSVNIRHHGSGTILRMMGETLNGELRDYRIYSLSKRYDNLSLWAKYAGDHSGYCLEFANQGPLLPHAREVTYGDSIIRMDVTNQEHRNGYWFFCKRQEWSNEEEIRLVLPRGHGCTVNIDPSWLTRLILGWRMSDAHRNQILEWASQRMPQLPIVSAHFDQVEQLLRLTG